MKIKKNTVSTLVLELFSPSIATCGKLKIQKNPKSTSLLCRDARKDTENCHCLPIVVRVKCSGSIKT
jgi:hypothetical protein